MEYIDGMLSYIFQENAKYIIMLTRLFSCL